MVCATLQLLELVQHGGGKVRGGGIAANVLGADLASSQHVVGGLADSVGMLIQTQMAQQHGRRQDHGSGVGLVAALDVETNVSAARLKHSVLTSNVDTGDETRATDKTGTNVGQNGTVQVGGDENVKLLGPRDGLHGGVVDNHVAVLNVGVVLADLLDGGSEQTVGELHNVGLVDGSDTLSVVLESKVVGKAGNALRLVLGDDLEGLNDTRDRLVFKTRVLTLGVFSNQNHVNSVESGLDSGNVLDQNQGGVDVEFTTEGDVEGSVAGLFNGGVEDTLETNLGALEGVDGLVDALGGVADTGDLDLLPVDGDVLGLEDALDRVGDFGTNTVT